MSLIPRPEALRRTTTTMIGVIDAVRVGIRRPELLEISTHFPLLLDFIQLNIERPDYSPFPTLLTELCYIVAPLSLLLTSAQVSRRCVQNEFVASY